MTPWEDQAACRRTVHPDVFFPQGHRDSADYQHALRIATAICAVCPARAACHRSAVAREERHGIWGGQDFTTDWRRDGRRRRAMASALNGAR